MDEQRVSTGIDELDRVIEGGFPKGSLILLTGNPGTGKTVFSARFLYRGATDYGENGVYVNFAESRETFYKNMRPFGFDFKRLEEEGKFRYLSMLTVRESRVSSILKLILEEINKVKAKRLVIDSFSAIAQALEKPHDARILIHTVLDRIVRYIECTTIVIVEVPFGADRIGLGIEEFVADGVIHLRMGRLEERLFRDMVIRKMRGTEVSEDEIGFTIKGGFKAFTSFETKNIERREKFKPLPDPPGKFSTGSEELDSLLNGGYPRGSIILLEIGRNVSTQQYHLILSPTPWSFLMREAGVIVLPSSGVDYNIVWRRAVESGLPKEKINHCLRVCIFRSLAAEKKPWLIEFEGKNMDEDFERYLEVANELREETGKPLLHITGIDLLLAHYGTDDSLKVINLSATMIRENGSLGIFLLKPGYPRISNILNSLVDIHLKMIREHGALLLYGLKPRTKLHFLEMNVSRGYSVPKLTPVV